MGKRHKKIEEDDKEAGMKGTVMFRARTFMARFSAALQALRIRFRSALRAFVFAVS
jgi:hypothetical protein